MLDLVRDPFDKPHMATATLTIDLAALIQNWRALDSLSNCETAAVVKADGYGLGADRVARALMNAGVRRFFKTTAGWDTPVLNDRAAPIYARAQRLTADQTALVDDSLSALSAVVKQV